jgi:phosphoribosylamine--glycine ligase
MIDALGNPRVIEFNCRFGDPETQPVMMRMRSDLVQLCLDAIDGKLAGQEINFDSRTALTVVIAAGGYPLKYRKGDFITGIPAENADSKTFHAGTSLQGDNVVTSGGRVLGVTALGNSVREAREGAYQIANKISFADSFFRTDIGFRAVEREEKNRAD